MMRTLAVGGGAVLLCSVIYSGYSGKATSHSVEESIVVQEPANVAYNAVVADMPSAGIYPLSTDRDQPPAEVRLNSRSMELIDMEIRISDKPLIRYQMSFHPIDEHSSTISAAMDVDEKLFRKYFLNEKDAPDALLTAGYRYALSKQLKQIGTRIEDGLPVKHLLLDGNILTREARMIALEKQREDTARLRHAQRSATAPMIDARPKAVRPMIDPSRPSNNGYNGYN